MMPPDSRDLEVLILRSAAIFAVAIFAMRFAWDTLAPTAVGRLLGRVGNRVADWIEKQSSNLLS